MWCQGCAINNFRGVGERMREKPYQAPMHGNEQQFIDKQEMYNVGACMYIFGLLVQETEDTD